VLGDQVRIKWVEPYSGGVGVQITAYEIELKTKTGEFLSHDECDGTQSDSITN